MEANFKDQYLAWLYENINQQKIRDGVYSITFPYLDRNNDFIEIFILMNPDGTVRLTDDGETINELDFSGTDLFRSNRSKKLLEQIVMSHGVRLGDDRSLYVDCDNDSLPAKKHLLAQCMTKISFLS